MGGQAAENRGRRRAAGTGCHERGGGSRGRTCCRGRTGCRGAGAALAWRRPPAGVWRRVLGHSTSRHAEISRMCHGWVCFAAMASRVRRTAQAGQIQPQPSPRLVIRRLAPGVNHSWGSSPSHHAPGRSGHSPSKSAKRAGWTAPGRVSRGWAGRVGRGWAGRVGRGWAGRVGRGRRWGRVGRVARVRRVSRGRRPVALVRGHHDYGRGWYLASPLWRVRGQMEVERRERLGWRGGVGRLGREQRATTARTGLHSEPGPEHGNSPGESRHRQQQGGNGRLPDRGVVNPVPELLEPCRPLVPHDSRSSIKSSASLPRPKQHGHTVRMLRADLRSAIGVPTRYHPDAATHRPDSVLARSRPPPGYRSVWYRPGVPTADLRAVTGRVLSSVIV